MTPLPYARILRMIEIIAGVWLTSLLLSLPITVLNVRYALKLSKTQKYSTLNRNLAKIGSYWSLSNESFASLQDGSPDEDAKRAMRSSLFLGGLGLLSVLGLLFLIVLSLSLQFLVRGRLTKSVFASELVRNPDLSPETVTRLVEDLRRAGA